MQKPRVSTLSALTQSLTQLFDPKYRASRKLRRETIANYSDYLNICSGRKSENQVVMQAFVLAYDRYHGLVGIEDGSQWQFHLHTAGMDLLGKKYTWDLVQEGVENIAQRFIDGVLLRTMTEGARCTPVEPADVRLQEYIMRKRLLLIPQHIDRIEYAVLNKHDPELAKMWTVILSLYDLHADRHKHLAEWLANRTSIKPDEHKFKELAINDLI